MDQVIALFDFNSTDPGELSFKRGERLTVLDRKYEHWWLCKNGSGMSGVVPCNHIKLKSRLVSESISTQNATRSTSSQQPTPISKKMTARDVVAQLADHGCKDLTDGLDSSSFGEYPVMHGGFSDIYRGLLSDGVRVAVKALRVSVDTITHDPKHLKRAARELHTWSKCKHPNVISLLGLALFRGRIGMIAPWMANGSLPRYLARVPEADRSNMSIQICEGLAYLHQIGIIHCDLKGANVLVSEEENPVLTDFGNSSLADRTLGFTETTSGPSFTLRWSAAEILEENPSHTEASDVYALGMTIYETMTGKVPYHGKNDTSVFLLVTVKRELPERPKVMLNDEETSDKLWRLLTMCWSFEPAARPNAADVAKTMRAIASNEEAPLLRSTASSSQNVLKDEAKEAHLNEQLKKPEKDDIVPPSIIIGPQRMPVTPDAESTSAAVSEDTVYQEEHDQNKESRLLFRRMLGLSIVSSGSSTSDTSAGSNEEPPLTFTTEADRQVWANNLMADWKIRDAHEEYYQSHLRPAPDPQSRVSRSSPTSSYPYRAAAGVHHAETFRLSQEQQEDVKYQERLAARAVREERAATAARKAFEEERRRLEDERRKREDERRKNEEQIVIATWQRYERGWQDLINGVVEDRPLTFYDIPWPVSMPARSAEELQSPEVEKFLLSPWHSTTKTRKMRLRAALMQWHPDKFARRFDGRIEESHRAAILTAVNSVARTITELMNRESE